MSLDRTYQKASSIGDGAQSVYEHHNNPVIAQRTIVTIQIYNLDDIQFVVL